MNTQINLSKVKLCDQHWEDMSVCDKGRVCGKCQETIVDFRGLSDSEIGLIHGSSKTKVCGIYDQHRLQEFDVIDAALIPKKKMLWAGALSLLFSGSVQAEHVSTDPSSERIEVLQGSENEKTNYVRTSASKLKENLHIVRGILTDERGEALIGCYVLVQKTNTHAITDIDGSFSIDVTDRIKKKNSITLLFSLVGYGTKEVVVETSEFGVDQEVELNVILEPQKMMETFGVYTRPPFFKRAWLGITNVFRKKENKR